MFSCLSGIIGVAVVAWYGFAERTEGTRDERQEQGQTVIQVETLEVEAAADPGSKKESSTAVLRTGDIDGV